MDVLPVVIYALFFRMRLIFILFLLILTACSSGEDVENMFRASKLNGFAIKPIAVSPFILTARERVATQKSAVNIYIEGDGRAWLSKRTPSLDPTPNNPVTLKLAQLDNSKNVIYLARPCQYSKTVDSSPCEQKYWTTHRFSTEVIDAMNDALSDIKRRYQITGFNLIGFSGGGNVAVLLAARRSDVLSIRTVAGNLDHELQSNIHNVSQIPSSLNAKNVAMNIKHIPQLHFIGGQDKIVPEQVYKSYKNSSGQSDCVKSYVVNTASHIKGWESVWKSLLNQPINCPRL